MSLSISRHIGLGLAAIFSLIAAGAVLTAPAAAHPTVDIVTSNWKFTPSTVEMHVGETTVLHLTSSQGVHGIQSDELGIPLTTITPDKFVDVSVTPKKAGTYKIHCAIVCGPGHGDMVLTVQVLDHDGP